ncbi:MAG: hypothetical protein Q4D57_00945 [Clostridia bacterium]|nr:hypothetical protein [Clostridia bacterium]
MFKDVSKKLFLSLCTVALLAGSCSAMQTSKEVGNPSLSGSASSVSGELVFSAAKFNDASINIGLKAQMEKYKTKIEANQDVIEAIKKDADKMAQVNAYFRDHKIYAVDFANGQALLDNDGKPAAPGGTFRRTAMFKFFKGLGVITPTFGVLKELAANQGWYPADMEKAMKDATAGTKYRIPVELDEDTKIYAYVKSSTESPDKIEEEFKALCPPKSEAIAK